MGYSPGITELDMTEKIILNLLSHYIFLPHLLYLLYVDGHLGCFHVLATVKSAALNIGVPHLLPITLRIQYKLLGSVLKALHDLSQPPSTSSLLC